MKPVNYKFFNSRGNVLLTQKKLPLDSVFPGSELSSCRLRSGGTHLHKFGCGCCVNQLTIQLFSPPQKCHVSSLKRHNRLSVMNWNEIS